MARIKRIGLCALCACLTIAGLTACGSSSKGKSSGGGGAATTKNAPIVVAASLGLTGGMSFYDTPFLTGVKLAIQHYNAAGGLDGHKLKLIQNDNGTNLGQLASKAQQLLSSHPTILLTSNSDTTGIPAAKAAQAAGVLTMSQVGPTDFGSELGPLVFNDYSGDPTEAAVVAQFAKQKGWNKLAFAVDQSNGYTIDSCKLLAQSFAKLGGQVVKQTTYSSTTDTSFPSQVSAIRSATSAQAVVICGLVSTAPTLIKQLRAAGVTLPIYGLGGGLDGDYWEKSIPAIGQFYSDSIGAENPAGGSVYPDNPNPTQAAFLKLYTKTSGSYALPNAVSGYEAIQLLAAAVKKDGGKLDSKSLAAAMNTFHNVPGIEGPTSYSSSCHVAIGRPLAITTVHKQGGKYVGKYLETIRPSPADIIKTTC